LVEIIKEVEGLTKPVKSVLHISEIAVFSTRVAICEIGLIIFRYYL